MHNRCALNGLAVTTGAHLRAPVRICEHRCYAVTSANEASGAVRSARSTGGVKFWPAGHIISSSSSSPSGDEEPISLTIQQLFHPSTTAAGTSPHPYSPAQPGNPLVDAALTEAIGG